MALLATELIFDSSGTAIFVEPVRLGIGHDAADVAFVNIVSNVLAHVPVLGAWA